LHVDRIVQVANELILERADSRGVPSPLAAN